MKRKTRITLIIISFIVVIITIVFFLMVPRPGKVTINLPYGAIGISDRFVYSYLIPSGHGVILIDAGIDTAANAIKKSLLSIGKKTSDIKAIILTHGHSDHYGGIHAFNNVPVYADSNDIKLIEGKRIPSGIIRKLVGRISKNNLPGVKIIPFFKDTLFIDSDTIVIIPIPGHTMGSVALLWKNIIFVGDAFVYKKNSIRNSPSIFSENNQLNIKSLHTLLNYQFDIAVTGHSGKIENAKTKLKEFLSKQKKQDR